MDKTKPFEVIATKFNLSRESAKYFLVQVQKSFKKEKPPESLIMETLQGMKLKTLPKPHQVAARMHANGLWVHPLNAEPPSIEDERDLYQ